MDAMNRPVEMISVCSATGEVTPVRFRFEVEDRSLHTVQITEVVSVKPVTYVGIEAMVFLCRTRLNGLEHLMELKYTVPTHRWVLFRVIC